MAKLSLDDFKGKEEEVKKDFPEKILSLSFLVRDMNFLKKLS